MNAIFNGMPADSVSGATWRKSKFSGAQGNCVEVAELPTGDVAMRNSRDPRGPALIYTRDEMEAFTAGIKDGEFDWTLPDQVASEPTQTATVSTNMAPVPDSSSTAPRHLAVGDELQSLADTILGGETVLDREAAERLLRVLGAVVALHQMHSVDRHGHCSICRPAPRFRLFQRPKHDVCSVYRTLSVHLGHSMAPVAGQAS